MAHKPLPWTFMACLVLLGYLAVAHGVTFEVKTGNSTCIKAELSANFTIRYPVANGTKVVTVQLPNSAVVGTNSTCGGSGVPPQLMASFGSGHSLDLTFFIDGQKYHVANLSLRYNLSDNATFPQSSEKKLITVVTNTSGILAQLNTTYRCFSSISVPLGSDVNITLYNVRMEAYMSSANLSTNETVCSADQTLTTTAPIPPTTTAAPSPVPPSKPDSGNYNVTNTNSTVCLKAKLGLQLNVTYFSKSQNKTIHGIENIQPNITVVSGSCEATTAVLMLTGDRTNLSFTFTLNSTTNKYHLSAVNVSARWPDMTAPFSVSNTTLNVMPGTVGRSYMCTPEQTLNVTSTFSLNTFDVQVQPFGVKNNTFGSAEECPLQQDNMLVPIIVGASLAGLVLIVLIAYLIGRKRSHAGYQTI